jgi:hypothetical protein
MHIGGKCNDMSHLQIPHLNVDHDGYMPHLGIFGGDYIELSICMDCGTIQNWEPVTDEMVAENEELEEARERQARWAAKRGR